MPPAVRFARVAALNVQDWRTPKCRTRRSQIDLVLAVWDFAGIGSLLSLAETRSPPERVAIKPWRTAELKCLSVMTSIAAAHVGHRQAP
jgi:hypothetical protein